ncbi:hypothetical protein B0A53_06517 [Rhodotorula sp. CCFEE 5036]|nr:hypothetical protein B0A53_06517 [Rhodotorula sp. CCFEE 5036]
MRRRRLPRVHRRSCHVLSYELLKPASVFHPVNRSKVPLRAKILGACFIYQRKKDQNSQVTGHKVRLVTQGFTHWPNVDFDRNDLDKTQRIKDSLIREYSIKDLGEAKFISGNG